jgi:hypothetical protein
LGGLKCRFAVRIWHEANRHRYITIFALFDVSYESAAWDGHHKSLVVVGFQLISVHLSGIGNPPRLH